MKIWNNEKVNVDCLCLMPTRDRKEIGVFYWDKYQNNSKLSAMPLDEKYLKLTTEQISKQFLNFDMVKVSDFFKFPSNKLSMADIEILKDKVHSPEFNKKFYDYIAKVTTAQYVLVKEVKQQREIAAERERMAKEKYTKSLKAFCKNIKKDSIKFVNAETKCTDKDTTTSNSSSADETLLK